MERPDGPDAGETRAPMTAELHETHVCRDCGAEITIPHAGPAGQLFTERDRYFFEAGVAEGKRLERTDPLDVPALTTALILARADHEDLNATPHAEALNIARHYAAALSESPVSAPEPTE